MTTNRGDRDSGFAPLSDGGEIAYEITGSGNGGTPLVLLRPLGGTLRLWAPFADSLAASYTVVSFDHRGSGRSSGAPTCVTTAGLARDALQLLDHLEIPQAHVFGISLGGMAATWVPVLGPGRVTTLCLASTPATGLELTHAGIRRELALAAAFVRRPADVEAHLVQRTLSRGFRQHHPEAARRIELLVRSQPSSPAALLKHALAGALHDARGVLPMIDVPTLVLAGEDDALLGVEASRSLARAIPGAELEVIPAAGHALTLEQPVATAARLRDLLQGRRPDRARGGDGGGA